MEKTSRNSLKKSVNELKVGLLKLSKPTYHSIDKLMREIMKKDDLTAKELHYGFRKLNQNQTPDEWIKSRNTMKTFKEFVEQANYINEIFGMKVSPTPKSKKQEVLAYKNYKPGILNKKSGKFTQRSHSPEEQKRYGWKPVKSSVYAPGDRFTPNKVTATGDPHNWKTRNAAVPFKYKEGQAPKGKEGEPSIKYGSQLKLTSAPMGSKTKSTTAKINDVGDFGKTGNVNKDVSFDVSPQITKDIAGKGATPEGWGKRMVYAKVVPSQMKK